MSYFTRQEMILKLRNLNPGMTFLDVEPDDGIPIDNRACSSIFDSTLPREERYHNPRMRYWRVKL